MAQKSDALTRWWRRISLRAKVTGVTVAVLALGLLAAGIGTVPILRTSLIGTIDSQLSSLASSDLAGRYFDISADEGQLSFLPLEDPPRTNDFFLAIYSAEGEKLAEAGGTPDALEPEFPETFSLQQAYAREGETLSLDGEEHVSFHGTVAVGEAAGIFYVQYTALPLTDADHIVGLYFGVYTSVALITIFIAALLIRGLVTLTFRRLGQVEATAMSIAAGDFSQRLTDLEPSTEVGRLNAAINTMLDRVDRSLAQRDRTVAQMRRFIGDASHELRTPLVSVRGYAELYRMGAITGTEDTARAMERIEKEAIRMGVLVEDLLALARLDEEPEVQIVPLDLRPIARDAALDVRAAAPHRTVTVVDRTAILRLLGANAPAAPTAPVPDTPTPASTTKPPTARGRAGATLSRFRRRPRTASIPEIDFTEATDTPVPTPPIILGEENRVRQVVTNLLGNARRFSDDDSPIEIIVDADRARGMGSISVADHGEGIPPQIREQIFERFWRADTSRARETGGSGLGLAIVASIVTALNGSVDVGETPGGGATFTVSFPLAPTQSIPEHLLQETQPLDRLNLSDH